MNWQCDAIVQIPQVRLEEALPIVCIRHYSSDIEPGTCSQLVSSRCNWLPNGKSPTFDWIMERKDKWNKHRQQYDMRRRKHAYPPAVGVLQHAHSRPMHQDASSFQSESIELPSLTWPWPCWWLGYSGLVAIRHLYTASRTYERDKCCIDRLIGGLITVAQRLCEHLSTK